MPREPIVSTSIASIGYAAMSSMLEVEYVNGGVYQYMGVSADEHQALMDASSKGEHVNRYIRGCFSFRKVAGGGR